MFCRNLGVVGLQAGCELCSPSQRLEFPAPRPGPVWEAVLGSGFGLVDKYPELCFHLKLFHPRCLPSAAPRLVLPVVEWLQASVKAFWEVSVLW